MPKRRRNNEQGVVYQLTNKEIADLTKAFDSARLKFDQRTAEYERFKKWEQFFLAGLTDKVGQTTEIEVLDD